MLGWRKTHLRRISYMYLLLYSFKLQNMAGAGAGIMDKGGAGAENK